MAITFQLFMFCASFAASAGSVFIPGVVDRLVPLPDGLAFRDVLRGLFLTPAAVLASFWLLTSLIGPGKPLRSSFALLALFVLAQSIALQGQGIHLASNSIHSHVNPGNELPSNASRFARLLYFFDEHLGHHVWFCGLCSGWLVLLLAERRAGGAAPHAAGFVEVLCVCVLGAIHGVGWFAVGVEGQASLTVTLPFSVIALLGTGERWMRGQRCGSVELYFAVCALVCVSATVAWGSTFGWHMPEFRVLGLGPFSTWPGQAIGALKLRAAA